MRQFKKALQSRLIEEDFEGVIKSLITLSDQMGNNLLMNEAMLYYQRWQELQRLSEPNTPDAERLNSSSGKGCGK